MLIQWVLPCAGTTKLNTNGCWNETNRMGGFGGLLGDANGKWQTDAGIQRKTYLRVKPRIEAVGNLQRVNNCLRRTCLMSQLSKPNLALKLINEGGPENHAQRNIIKDANALLIRGYPTSIEEQMNVWII